MSNHFVSNPFITRYNAYFTGEYSISSGTNFQLPSQNRRPESSSHTITEYCAPTVQRRRRCKNDVRSPDVGTLADSGISTPNGHCRCDLHLGNYLAVGSHIKVAVVRAVVGGLFAAELPGRDSGLRANPVLFAAIHRRGHGRRDLVRSRARRSEHSEIIPQVQVATTITIRS